MDLKAALEHDPAAKSALEIILTYNGFTLSCITDWRTSFLRTVFVCSRE